MPSSAPAVTALLFGLRGCLVDFGAQACAQPGKPLEPAKPTPGAMDTLSALRKQGVPCAWLDELPTQTGRKLAATLPDWVAATHNPAGLAPWPAPDACWQALMALKIPRLDGCVLVSGEPRLLQSGLNAGLWTIGLASCGALCGLSAQEWKALDARQQEQKRSKATLALYGLGVHSVIDHLEELQDCLADIGHRRLKGERP
ncbi:hypothetical protein [Pseudomonas sp. R5(2019)]|uniref:hypothetical protein n=1 Tax=Pseudomonas sp. R5(2019) TaxID=2697566 RepID=UPI0014135082|nr:hypothetical protein [Pseudomonas sp. R5(2019)]NBA93774.1 hypothetical protein [Pseudomonas sp. R5(2019)]